MTPAKDELADEIEAIRADIQNLTSTVGRIANDKLHSAQAGAVESAKEAEEVLARMGQIEQDQWLANVPPPTEARRACPTRARARRSRERARQPGRRAAGEACSTHSGP